MRLKGKKYWVALLRARDGGGAIPFTVMRLAPCCGGHRPAEVRVYTSRWRLMRTLKSMPRDELEARVGQLGPDIPPATWMAYMSRMVQGEVERYGAKFKPEMVLGWPVVLNGSIRAGTLGPVAMLEIFRDLEVRGVELGAVIPEAKLFPKVQKGGEA